MTWNAAKKLGRRKASSWGRLTSKYQKRMSAKALRRLPIKDE